MLTLPFFTKFETIEFIIGLSFWWVAVYIISQNPFTRLNQLFFAIFAVASIYLSSDIFFSAVDFTNQPHFTPYVLKSVVWTTYLPMALYFHISFLLIEPARRQKWQKVFLPLAYVFASASIFMDTFTNITRDYRIMLAPGFNGDTVSVTSQYLWLNGVLQSTIIIATALNFFQLLKKQPKYSLTWQRYLWPLIGLTSLLILIPIIVLGYYQFLPYPTYLLFIGFALTAFTLCYSVVRYDLIIADIKLVFGKRFIYSTIAIILILVLFGLTMSSSVIRFNTVQSLIFPYLLIYLIIASHPLYNWLNTFIADLSYNISSGLSVVNDQEIAEALRNYHRPDQLESSPLLRLNLVTQDIKSNQAKNPVDALRQILAGAVEYFQPKEDKPRRIKENLKHHFLKMYTFDQAEEGQILWELGFNDYPVKILQVENESRPPLFKTISVSDYPHTSRTAFIALKREAIHSITWRISYLEKLAKQ